MVRLLVALLFFALPAAAQVAWPPEAKLELRLDPMPEGPLVGEMMLATLHGEYIGNVALERLEVPGFEDFSWLQLAPPVWTEQRIDNRATKVVEQRLAFFPRRAGALEIGSIAHHLTFAGQGQRVEVTAASAPVPVVVGAPLAGPAGKISQTAAGGWLPARAVTVEDVWEPEPNRLKPEEWTRRRVTIEVTGLPPQALPPAPPMAAGGLFSFVDPEERSVRLTPEGPVSTVIWHYRMQPQSDAPADLDDIPIQWFDTGARIPRRIVLEGREIAFAASALPREPGPVARVSIRLGLVGGVLVAGALLLPGVGARRGTVPRRARRAVVLVAAVARLRWAEWRGDGGAARAALLDLLRARERDAEGSAALARLDLGLFGPGSGRADLSGLTRAALREG